MTAQETTPDCPASMAVKYCGHHYTHGCTMTVEASEELCTDCSKGLC